MSGLGLGLGLGLGTHRKVGTKLDPATVAYIKRVEADGGNVINRALTDSIIKAIKDDGAWDYVHSIYTSISGIKLDGSNYVTKLYDVMGATNDLTSVGTTNKPQHDVDDRRINGLPAITFVSASSQYLRGSVSSNDNNGIIISVQRTAKVARQAISGGYIDGSFYGEASSGKLITGPASGGNASAEQFEPGLRLTSLTKIASKNYIFTSNGVTLGQSIDGDWRAAYILTLGATIASNVTLFFEGEIAAHITLTSASASIAGTLSKLNEIFAIY
jgi:hypothetical protein